MSKSILSLAFAIVLGFAGVSQANHGCTNCGIASPQGAAPSAQSVVSVASCGGGCGKSFSLPHISMPKISLPKLVHTTSCEYVLKKKHHFSLVKREKGCSTCGPVYAAPVASAQASGQH